MVYTSKSYMQSSEVLEQILTINEERVGHIKDEYAVCYPLTGETVTESIFEAYHVGPKDQDSLRVKSEPFRSSAIKPVFFSLSPYDALHYLTGENRDDIVYGADIRGIPESRVQVSYQPKVIGHDRFMGNLREKYGMEYAELDEILSSFPEVKDTVREYMDNWMRKHTIPFNPNRVERYRKKNLTYLLVPGPISVT